MKLTEHFTLEELINSNTAKSKGIDNSPTKEALEQLKELANLLEQIRLVYNKPIKINSGYRGPKLNSAVGGSKTSQHMKGAAADIVAIKGSNAELFGVIKKMIDNKEIKVGQLIWEYGTKTEPNWVHVSLPYTKINNILYLYSK